jgi:cobalt-zinc-cadmium efflux system membrane fusion protein
MNYINYHAINYFKMKHYLIILTTVLAITAFSSCNSGGGKEQPEENAEAAQMGEERSAIIELSPAQMKAVGIEIGTIQQKNLKSVVKASGQLEVPPQNKANVSVLMGGAIKTIFVLEGNYVKKGQTLATIENPDFIKLQQDYLTTKSELSYLEQAYQRQKELHEQNAGTGKIFQQTSADYNAQKAKLKSLEEQLGQIHVNMDQLSKGNIIPDVPVVAPIGGTVGHIYVNTGAYVDPTKPLMDIVDNSKIHCDLLVYEKDLFKVKPGQKVNFVLTNQDNNPISGEIYGINKNFEKDIRAVIAHAVIKDPVKSRLIPGMYVSALIDVGNQTVPAVPVDALVRSAGKEYIYEVTRLPGAKDSSYGFKKVEVASGVTDLGYTEITLLGEKSPQDKIVTKGAFYILSQAESGSEEEE